MSTTSPGVQSLHRALDLLDALDERGALPLAEAATAASIPAATAHRLLRTLVERGYVRQQPDRRYALGFRLVPLGRTATDQLQDVGHEVLADLVAELGETANLAVLAGSHAEYVAQAPGRYAVRMFTQVGARVALHSSGVGKAMLAQLTPEQAAALLTRAGLPRSTAHTLTTVSSVQEAVARVRAEGFAQDQEEQELGVRCVAAPVPGTGVAMAVSISGPLSRLTDAVVAHAVPALQVAARRLVEQRSGTSAAHGATANARAVPENNSA